MVMWGDKLECHTIELNGVPDVLRAFVVQDVKFGDAAGGTERSIKVWYAWIILPEVLFFVGSTRMASLSTSIRTMMYCFL